MRRYLSLIVLLTTSAVLCTLAVNIRADAVSSPSGKIRVNLRLEDGHPMYSIAVNRKVVIGESCLGLVMADGTDLSAGLKVIEVKRDSIESNWIQPWGQRREVLDRHNELRFIYGKSGSDDPALILVFRVYDDGVGFRYELPQNTGPDEFIVVDEKTEFAITGDNRTWWIPAFENNRYEYLYTESAVSSLRSVHTPLTMVTREGIHLSIDEAALTDWASMTLKNVAGRILKCELVPWADGAKVKGKRPAVTPWRTVIISGDAAGLLTSTMILNLNEPSRIEDTSWIEPGRYMKSRMAMMMRL